MDWLKALIRAAIETFPIEQERKEKLLKKLLEAERKADL